MFVSPGHDLFHLKNNRPQISYFVVPRICQKVDSTLLDNATENGW